MQPRQNGRSSFRSQVRSSVPSPAAVALWVAALAVVGLWPATAAMAGTASQFQALIAGPVSGPPYPAGTVKTGLLNLNNFPPTPVFQQNESLSLAVLNAYPPQPIAPPIDTALTMHVDAASPTLALLDLFYPPTPIMPAGTFVLSYQAINPRNASNLPMTLIGLANVTPTSFDLLFSADVPEEIQGDGVPNSPAGLEVHTLHAAAMQGLTFANVGAPALGNFTFDLSGGTVNPSLPIVATTLAGDFTTVPEPCTFALAAAGFLTMIVRRPAGGSATRRTRSFSCWRSSSSSCSSFGSPSC